MGKIANSPVRILIDSSFTSEQIHGIQYAIAQWNVVAQQTLRHDVFQAEVTAVPDSVRKMDPGNCDSNFGDETTFRIVREQDMNHWKLFGFTSRIPGATFRCEQNARVVRQIVYIYDSLVAKEQFNSVVVHELGHAVGLDHSCLDGEGRADYRSCTGLDTNHPYKVAVMYPWLKVSTASGTPEVKDVLRVNDKQRGQCVMW